MLRRFHAPALVSAATVLLHVSPSFADWATNVNYGATTKMDLYTPAKPATAPPIVVVLHYCGGNAGNAHTWLQSYADKYGFLLIAPTAGGNCFDATPTRMGERANVVAMVNYTVMMKSADAKRVYSVGASSGACMTQALLAAYPDVFAAGSSLAGVPAGAWTGPGNTYGWSTSGVSGGQAWGDKVRAADPGFTGTRPRVQLWQGQGDTTLTYSQTYPAEVAQWTNVFGVTDANATKEMIKPTGANDTWDRTSYKDASGTVVVEANSGPSNVPHDLTGRGLWGDVVRFFGLDGSVAPGSGGMGGVGGMSGASGASTGGAPQGGAGGARAGAGGASVAGAGPAAGTGSIVPPSGGNGGSAGTGAPTAGTGTGAAGTAPATGGTTSSAGNTGSGGTGGTTTGGAGKPSGGQSAGGKPGAAGSGATSSGDDDEPADTGCGCRIAPAGDGMERTALAAVGLGALGLLLRRRRR
jgi:poly(hydroxyalkanoate) depolymerase family esterase